MNSKRFFRQRIHRMIMPAVTVGVCIAGVLAVSTPARAQHQRQPFPGWFHSVWNQASSIVFDSTYTMTDTTPAIIPEYFEQVDETGAVATFQPAGASITANHAFFSPLGSNGRSCYTCHQPQAGWAMNPASAQAIFVASKGRDPLFAPVDGSNCPNAELPATSLAQRALASSQLLTKGNFRVFLPIPASAQFEIRVLSDPYGCENSAQYGLPSGVISMYRRALNATNLTRNAVAGPPQNPEGELMWDGREVSLESQFRDAVLGHAQGTTAPTDDEVAQGVGFEQGLFTSQSFNRRAGDLSAKPSAGGPVNLSLLAPPNVPGAPVGFTQYAGWRESNNAAQASIARGESIFNTHPFTLSGVAGFNDVIEVASLSATCSTCHNSMNVGTDVFGGLKHLGIADNSSSDQEQRQAASTALPPTSDQPLFAFDCPVGSIPFFSNPVTVGSKTFDEFQTTDPGLGLLTGHCADLGKFKVPRLSGLASRAPYFHNGSAASLRDVVDFYETRFQIGLTDEEKKDLISFLHSL